MRPVRFLLAVAIVTAPVAARAAEPVTVALREKATVGKSLVTVGDVALVSGGDESTRARVAKVDIAELTLRRPDAQLGRRAVEYRLLLAGFDAKTVRATGAEWASISLARRAVTTEEVVAAAKAELLKSIPAQPGAEIALAMPVVVKLPELPADERPVITAKPHGRVATPGRAQMDVSIASSGEHLLSLAVYLEVKSGQGVAPAGFATAAPAGTKPPAPAATGAGEILIKPRERVTMEVRSGGLTVRAVGEAQQQGRLGQNIMVQNVDSKKVIVARVTGPSTVEVDIGGPP
jgi:hypothetical protein